jgi:VIT1/CCC1 family predicted Fe2+/Mn2+ transporter
MMKKLIDAIIDGVGFSIGVIIIVLLIYFVDWLVK